MYLGGNEMISEFEKKLIENIQKSLEEKTYIIKTKKEIKKEYEESNEENKTLKINILINNIIQELKIYFKVEKYSGYLLIYTSAITDKEIKKINLRYQLEKTLNEKLMVLYFQIKNHEYYGDEKEEDYTTGFLFGKMWNLDFLDEFTKEIEKNSLEKNLLEKNIATKAIEIIGIKKNELPRKFGYPNFINFIDMRDFLLNEIDEYIKSMEENEISLSKNIKNSFSDNRKIEQKNFNIKNSKKILKLDIQNFYGSIYTHAIDWSIRGKEICKTDKRSEKFSAKLDKKLMSMNDGETFGILIGSTLSRIIAEIFIINIEEKLNLKNPGKLYRFVDDYTYFYDNDEEKKEFLDELTKLLSEFNLNLNGEKTEEIEKIDYLKKNKKETIYNKIEININYYLKEEKINNIASIIYEYIYRYIEFESNNLYIMYSEIEKIFKDIKIYDVSNKTEYFRKLKKTKIKTLLIEIFLTNKGLDRYFLEFIYNNFEKNEIDKEWTEIFNEEIKKYYKQNNVYTIQILSLMFTFGLEINESNIENILKEGDSISSTIVYSQIEVNMEKEKYEKKIIDRAKNSIEDGGFGGKDFFFLTEFYLRDNQEKNQIFNWSDVDQSGINNKYRSVMKKLTNIYIVDYKNIK